MIPYPTFPCAGETIYSWIVTMGVAAQRATVYALVRQYAEFLPAAEGGHRYKGRYLCTEETLRRVMRRLTGIDFELWMEIKAIELEGDGKALVEPLSLASESLAEAAVAAATRNEKLARQKRPRRGPPAPRAPAEPPPTLRLPIVVFDGMEYVAPADAPGARMVTFRARRDLRAADLEPGSIPPTIERVAVAEVMRDSVLAPVLIPSSVSHATFTGDMPLALPLPSPIAEAIVSRVRTLYPDAIVRVWDARAEEQPAVESDGRADGSTTS